MTSSTNYSDKSFDDLRKDLLVSFLQNEFLSLPEHCQDQVNEDSWLLLEIEILRGRKIQQLASSLTSLAVKYSPKKFSSSDVLKRSISQLLPTWFVTFKNFEWKRSLVDPSVRDAIDSTAVMQHRRWICPLLDVGREVAPCDNGSASSRSCLVADALPPDDNSLLVVPLGADLKDASKIVKVELKQFVLAEMEGVPFYRDPLIPSLEEEPAGRCGSATIYSKFRFEYGVCDDMNVKDEAAIAARMNLIMREVGKICQDTIASLHLEIQELIEELKKQQNGNAKIATVESSSENDSEVVIKIPALAPNNNERRSWTIGKFHLVKLLIMFVQQRMKKNTTNGNKLFESEMLNIISSSILNSNASSPLKNLLDAVIKRAIVDPLNNSRKQNEGAEGNNNNNVDHHKTLLQEFLRSLCRCIQRYRNFDGDDGVLGNLHAAIHPSFALSLHASIELFANPFNTSSLHFCSLFGPSVTSKQNNVAVSSGDVPLSNKDDEKSILNNLDLLDNVDGVFGSLGTCWKLLGELNSMNNIQEEDSKRKQTLFMLEANPPFDTSVVQRLAKAMESLSLKSDIVIPLAVVIIIPEPRTDVKHDSKYAPTVANLKKMSLINTVMPSKSAVYVRGLQQQQQQQHLSSQDRTKTDECITIQRDTAVIMVCFKGKNNDNENGNDSQCPMEGKQRFQQAVNEWTIASEKRTIGMRNIRQREE